MTQKTMTHKVTDQLIPILPGDYPDPSIVRVGEDYYITHSSFDFTPGLLIWHSRNLTEWEPVGHAIQKHMGSIMAPDFVYHNGLFYIYFPAAGTNWVVTAESAAGPWSDPVDLKVGYIDPGHISDPEGNRYLHLSDGHVIPLARDGLSTIGDLSAVYEGWRYPSEWRTEGFYLESPKLTYRNGFYYMTCAQGGTGGPATSHMIISARSTSPVGPWENSPYNPILRTQSREERWWSRGHGTLVDTPEENWYMVYHAYENGFLTLGRQTLAEPVSWYPDGWFGIADDYLHALAVPTPAGLNLSDDFSAENLKRQWHFFGGRRQHDYSVGKGELTLTGIPLERVKPLLCIPFHHSYEVMVTVRVEAGAEGRLSLFYKPGFQNGIGFDGKRIYTFRNNYCAEHTPFTGNEATLRMVNDRHEVVLYYMTEQLSWRKLDHSYEMSGFHNNVLGSFLSLRIALEAIGEGKVAFSNFRYTELF
jgi:xylan 1,4-beta-xylosidase